MPPNVVIAPQLGRAHPRRHVVQRQRLVGNFIKLFGLVIVDLSDHRCEALPIDSVYGEFRYLSTDDVTPRNGREKRQLVAGVQELRGLGIFLVDGHVNGARGDSELRIAPVQLGQRVGDGGVFRQVKRLLRPPGQLA